MKTITLSAQVLLLIFSIFYCPISQAQVKTEMEIIDIMKNDLAEPDDHSGSFLIGSGPINHVIADNDEYMWTHFLSEDLQPGSYVTTVEIFVWIDANGSESTFSCQNYEIFVDNLTHGGTGDYIKIWNNLGTNFGYDGGHDDDPEDDKDIYINFRETDAFYGDPVNNIWAINIVDEFEDGNSGRLVACYLRVHWECPLPNLTTHTAPDTWSSPIVISDVSGTHTDATEFIAGEPYYLDYLFIVQDQQVSDDFDFGLFIDEAVYNFHPFYDETVPEYYMYAVNDEVVTFAAGTHEICISVDDGGMVEESDETDNIFCRTEYWRLPVPGTPLLTLPENNASCVALSTCLEWESASDAMYYYIGVDDNEDFSSPLIEEPVLADVQALNIEDLEPSTTYYWMVIAGNDDGRGEWSEVRQFTTEDIRLDPPELALPNNEESCQPSMLSLSWDEVSDAIGYAYQLSPSPDFSAPLIHGNTVDDSITIEDLAYETTYYWKIGSINACYQVGEWSAIRNFTTGMSGLDAPILLEPANMSNELDTALEVSWEAVTDASTYQFQLAENADFVDPLLNISGIEGLSYELVGMNKGSTYYWHVSTTAECINSEWTETWQFETAAETEPVYLQQTNEESFSLGQNYPNPFQSKTAIEFSIPEDNQVVIDFIDMQGRVVERYSGYFTAGYHRVEIATELQQGVYFYKMVTGDYTNTKTCKVLRR